MKNNDSYKRSAVMHTFFTFYTVKDLADKISELSREVVGVELDVYITKTDGFVLRKRKYVVVGNQGILSLIASAIKSLIEMDVDDFVEYMDDHHDCSYNPSCISNVLVEEFFTITRNDRLYTVEIDMP